MSDELEKAIERMFTAITNTVQPTVTVDKSDLYQAIRAAKQFSVVQAKSVEKDDCIKWLILNPTIDGLQKDFITHKALSSICG